MVKTYSMKKEGSKKLSVNFVVSEFACKDGSDKVLIDTELVEILQKIRNYFGKPIIITSAYRNYAHNRKIGGVSNSQHCKGTAADICISTVEPAEIAKYAEYIMPNKGGIGLYSNFVHIDVRANRSRWTNFDTEKVVSGFPGYKEPVRLIETVNDIVWELAERGVITDKELWLEKLEKDKNAYWLARKYANSKIKPTENNLTAINDIIWELHHKGIITNKGLWLKKLTKDQNAYWLARKMC